MIQAHSILILLVGGTGLFLLGMKIASENLQNLAANRIRDMIAKLADRPFLALLSGVLITVLVQSSGAVTSTLVGLGTAGVVNLEQVMGIILGTGVGTTVTTQLLSLNVEVIGLPIFGIAFLIQLFSHKRVLNRVAQAVMGFGLMFFGLEVISLGTQALRDAAIFTETLRYFRDNPFAMLIVTALFTAMVRSSAVVVGIAMTMATAGLISVTDAFYWVYGANIGTTATALLASVDSNATGRQVAWAHCLHKVIMVSLFYFFTPYAAKLITTGNAARDVADAHLFFNCCGALLFFPFVKQGARIVQKLVPPRANEREFSVKYLDRATFESPSVVLAHAERECLRMADIVISMIRDSIVALRDDNSDLIADMRARDNRVDLLNREIDIFITRYMRTDDNDLHREMVRLFSFASDLESTADVVDNSIIELALKKHALKVEFSNEGWKELETLHLAVVEVAELSVSCFQLKSQDLAAKVVFKKRVIRKMERMLREAHIERMAAGRKETINTSSIHLDVLSDFRRMVGLLSAHVYVFLRER